MPPRFWKARAGARKALVILLIASVGALQLLDTGVLHHVKQQITKIFFSVGSLINSLIFELLFCSD
jgi:hypothetical protein